MNEIFNYSRSGKASLQKFKILKDRYKIFNKPQRARPTQSLNQIRPMRLNYMKINQFIFREIEQNKNQENLEDQEEVKPKPTFLTSSFKSPPRNFNAENDNPGSGYYNINYAIVDKKTKFPVFRLPKSEQTESQKILPGITQLHQFQPKRVRLPGIPFSKQANRDSKVLFSPEPHQNRFVWSNLAPTVCTKFKKQPYPRFSYYSYRE